jgi:hypothetical protein
MSIPDRHLAAEASQIPVQTFRYRVAPELRILAEGAAAAVWVATVLVLRTPGVDAFQMVICLPIAGVVGFLALYFGRLTRLEKVELYADRIVWTDLWRRTHVLPLSEVEGLETDRAFPFGMRYEVQGDGKQVRFFSTLPGSNPLLFVVRAALNQRRGTLPMSSLPWPGRTEYPFQSTDVAWLPFAIGTLFALPLAVMFCGGVLPVNLLLAGGVLWLSLTVFRRLMDQRVVIEAGELVLRDGWRERLRVPVGALRHVTVDIHDRGGSTATFDTDGGSFTVSSSVVGYDDLVQSAQEVVRDRFRNLPEP